MSSPLLARILREADVPGLLEVLAERLAPTDLRSLLLEVFRRRAEQTTPARLLADYGRDRFCAPSALDPVALARLELLAFARLGARGFEAVELSPVCPLGTHAAVATVDQNKVLTTVRATEVVADATNVLALECAVRRRRSLSRAARSRQRVRLAASHRVLRAQALAGPGLTAHFRLLALGTAGRDEGSFAFEAATLAEHVGAHLEVLAAVGAVRPRVSITDLSPAGHRREALRERVIEPLARARPEVEFGFDDTRTSGRGYYREACFEIRATAPDGEDLNLADGGLTGWTADLLSDAKERLMVSGLGLERLCGRFGAGGTGAGAGRGPGEA